MYPFNVILVGVPESIIGQLKAELANSGAEIDSELPSADAVARRFSEDDSIIRLLVIHDKPKAISASVGRLRDRFVNWPILALVDPSGDPAAMLAANRAGADQVVALPHTSTDFGEALGRLATRFRQADRQSMVIAVSGVVPGSDATNIAAVLAAEFARGFATQTILLEVALRMGVLAMDLNVHPAIHLTDLLAEAEKLDVTQFRKALTPVAPRLELLAAPPDLTRAIPDPVPGILKLIGLARQAAVATVIALGCTYDDIQFETLWAADQIVLVGDQSLPAVRTTRMILDAASQVKAVKRVHVVLNNYDESIGGLTAAKVSESLGGAEVLTIPNDYAGIKRAANEGRLLRDLVPNSPVLPAVRALAQALMGLPKLQQGSGNSFVTRLLGLFKPSGGVK